MFTVYVNVKFKFNNQISIVMTLIKMRSSSDGVAGTTNLFFFNSLSACLERKAHCRLEFLINLSYFLYRFTTLLNLIIIIWIWISIFFLSLNFSCLCKANKFE